MSDKKKRTRSRGGAKTSRARSTGTTKASGTKKSDAGRAAAPAPAVAPTASSSVEPKVPTPDDIRQRAYELFQARGGEGSGSALLDWLEAERQLTRP